jgi:predicted nucleotidyltransferase
MLKEDIIKNILRVLEKYEETVLFAYLFGSTAHGEGIRRSGDIDIAVFLSRGSRESYFEIKLSLYADLCRALQRNDVDLLVLNTATNLVLLDQIVRTGIVLRDRQADKRVDFEIRVLHRALDFKEQRLAVMGV